MKIRDKKLGETVDVSDALCPKRSCYWPRPDPGTFTQGQGYRTRPGKQGWLCGNREIRGCPVPQVCPKCHAAHNSLITQCRRCSGPLVQRPEENDNANRPDKTH